MSSKRESTVTYLMQRWAGQGIVSSHCMSVLFAYICMYELSLSKTLRDLSSRARYYNLTPFLCVLCFYTELNSPCLDLWLFERSPELTVLPRNCRGDKLGDPEIRPRIPWLKVETATSFLYYKNKYNESSLFTTTLMSEAWALVLGPRHDQKPQRSSYTYVYVQCGHCWHKHQVLANWLIVVRLNSYQHVLTGHKRYITIRIWRTQGFDIVIFMLSGFHYHL